MKNPKTFHINKVNRRNDSKTTFTGTLPELIRVFSYTLECGASWQHEKGNKKINREPKGIKSLVSNLNNAVNNSAANGFSNYYYELVENNS